MRILRKEGQKDFYDYMQGIYGQDELVIYDRRNAFTIDPTKEWGCDIRKESPYYVTDFQNSNIEKWFRKEVICGDKKREESSIYNSTRLLNYDDVPQMKKPKYKWMSPKTIIGRIYHFVLEVGYHHYYFEVERYIDDKDSSKIHMNYGLVSHKRIGKDDRVSSSPICIAPVSYRVNSYLNNDTRGDFVITKESREYAINNPILYSTYIPKFISAEDMWNNLYEYISSLRDKEFTDNRTNEQHIESHGFDKKISFRKRKV
jgi:hypothetical protein